MDKETLRMALSNDGKYFVWGQLGSGYNASIKRMLKELDAKVFVIRAYMLDETDVPDNTSSIKPLDIEPDTVIVLEDFDRTHSDIQLRILNYLIPSGCKIIATGFDRSNVPVPIAMNFNHLQM